MEDIETKACRNESWDISKNIERNFILTFLTRKKLMEKNQVHDSEKAFKTS